MYVLHSDIRICLEQVLLAYTMTAVLILGAGVAFCMHAQRGKPLSQILGATVLLPTDCK